jgi:hypothetical protein
VDKLCGERRGGVGGGNEPRASGRRNTAHRDRAVGSVPRLHCVRLNLRHGQDS